MSLIQKLKSRGYWRVVIRPTDFVAERIANINDLTAIIQKHAVEMRGWDFPHLGNESPKIGVDYIEKEVDWQHTLEFWRFYQSGQFVHYAGFFEDWRDQSGLYPGGPQWKAGQALGIGDSVARFTEIFEFASRLALTPAGGKEMEVQISLQGLENRQLYNDDRSRILFARSFTSALKEFPQRQVLSQTELTARPRELAAAVATKLFQRFGMDPKGDLVQTIQGHLRR